MLPSSKKSGFTLAETLIVIAIIAVVAAITTPILVSVKKQAKVTSSISVMRQWYVALELYRSDENGAQAVAYGEASTMGLPTPYAILGKKTVIPKELMRSPCAPPLAKGDVAEFSLGYVYFPTDTPAWADYSRTAEESSILLADTECHLGSTVTPFTTQKAIGLRLNGSIKVEAGRGIPTDLTWWNR